MNADVKALRKEMREFMAQTGDRLRRLENANRITTHPEVEKTVVAEDLADADPDKEAAAAAAEAEKKRLADEADPPKAPAASKEPKKGKAKG